MTSRRSRHVNVLYLCGVAPVLLRAERYGAEDSGRLREASEAPGGGGPGVGSEHAAGGPWSHAAAH